MWSIRLALRAVYWVVEHVLVVLSTGRTLYTDVSRDRQVRILYLFREWSKPGTRTRLRKLKIV